MKLKYLRRTTAAALLIGFLSACGNNTPIALPTAQPQLPTAAVPTAQPQLPTVTVPTAQPQLPTAAVLTPVPMQPTISFTPNRGGPGTQVTVSGWGFTPGAPVKVRLGLPQPTGEVLGSAFADNAGNWQASFVMPGRLPSGEPIHMSDMFLVAMDDANVALASAPFAFTPAPEVSGPSLNDATTTVHSFLERYFSGADVTSYLAGQLSDEVRAGRPLDQFVGSQPGFQGFSVSQPENRPSEALFVRAEVRYAGTTVLNEFTLQVINGTWKIIGIHVVGSGNNGNPITEWQYGPSGDFTGDGVSENIAYKPLRIQLQPTGFSDPSITNVFFAEELTITMEAAPGGRELLVLNPAVLMAENQMLAAFNNNPVGFVVVMYKIDGVYSFNVAAVDAGGAVQQPTYNVVWDNAFGGYRVK